MKNILILDDEEDLLEVLEFTLEEEGVTEFANLVMASNGEEGLVKIGETSFDLVISDINMPKMNGISFVKKIQEDGFKKPVMFLSAHGDPDTIKKIEGLEIFYFMDKPFKGSLLSQKIREALGIS